MRRSLLAIPAVSGLIMADPAVAADLPAKAPAPIPPFTWTSCYAGGHVGGAWATKDMTDPVQLVQDQLLGFAATIDTTTASGRPSGLIIGGQIGCDYQFASNWVIGLEGAISGSTLQGTVTLPLPLGDPGDQAAAKATTDMIPSVTARFGFAWDRWLLYAKGGVAWADDRFNVTGTFMGTPFNFQGLDFRTGWTVGAGVEWAIWEYWSVKLEYDYYDFGRGTVQMSDNVLVLSGPVDVKQTVQSVRLGLNFHVW